MNILLLDNFDSFTYNLWDYLCRLGAKVQVLRNDVCSAEAVRRYKTQALVLSPGPQRPKNAGCMMSIISEFYRELPILGVCLGHQAIGEFFGAELIHAALPMHGKISNISHSTTDIFANLPQPLPVMRYHSLILDSLANTPLNALAHSPTGEIMALRHEHLPIWGVQFHPESVGTPEGLRLLSNWLNLVKSLRPSRKAGI